MCVWIYICLTVIIVQEWVVFSLSFGNVRSGIFFRVQNYVIYTKGHILVLLHLFHRLVTKYGTFFFAKKKMNLLIYFNNYSQYFLYSVLDGTVVKGKQICFSLSFSVASLVSSSLAITRYFANYLFLSFFLSFSPLLVLRNKWSTLMNSLNTNLHWCGRPSD